LKRLRTLEWEEGLGLPLAADLDSELRGLLEGVMTRLIGHLPHSSRFLAQTARPSPPTPDYLSPRLAADPHSSRLKPSPSSSNCHACGIHSGLASRLRRSAR